MRPSARSRLFELLTNETGQSMVIVALSMLSLIGVTGVAVEIGHGYYAYQQLVASTNASVMAGAQAMPDTTVATANVRAYSSEKGQKNTSPLLTNVVATPGFLCLTTVANTLKTPCTTASGAIGGYNALKVTQTADVSSWFGSLFGIKTFHLAYTATAAMRGGTATPWNIAIVLDATASMASNDNGAQCNGTRESCALKGVQALLSDLYPCALGENCSKSTTYVDAVTLYVLPPPSRATAPYDYCAGGSPSSVSNGKYVVPTLLSGYDYKVFDFSNDYKTSDAASVLNTSSNAVKASGYSGTGCAGVYPKGGAGTYHAQVIYQAQAALMAQQSTNPNSKNALIILSDGDAEACASGANTAAGGCNSSSQLQASTGAKLNGITSNNKTSTAYPSALGECGQAVAAAQAATAAGTHVYTIGYGSPSINSCLTDQTYTTAGNITYGGGAWPAIAHTTDNGKQACDALAAMASTPSDFYSDGKGYGQCIATVPSNAAITQLTQIFHQITAGMTIPRLIPNDTK